LHSSRSSAAGRTDLSRRQDVRLHDLRHGFATALLQAGVNVKIVSEALGHARSSFTMDVYQHVLPGMGDQVARAIEDAFAATSAATRPSE